MIKVYCLDLGDAKMYAAAENILAATEVMLDTYDPELVEEGFEIKLLSNEELDAEVEDEDGQKSSWRSIINEPGLKIPCIIGEQF